MKMKLPMMEWDLSGKRVILRAGLNVPFVGNKILDDFRINAIRPTLDHLIKAGGQIIIITHLGRPTEHKSTLSTKLLIPKLQMYGYDVTFAPTIDDALNSRAPITLLENIRFFPGEQAQATGIIGKIKEKMARNAFASQLATLGDYYVNDAFSAMHRYDTSITLLAHLFAPEKRSVGLLVEREIRSLNMLIGKKDDGTINPRQPFCVLLGGGKSLEKINTIPAIAQVANTLLIAPRLALPFAAAQGASVGKSSIDTPFSNRKLNALLSTPKETVLPVDYQVAHESLDGPLSYTETENLPDDAIGISIGPKTVTSFAEHLQAARNIFFNGLFGLEHREESMKSVQEIIKIIAESNAFTVAAGGSSVAAVRKYGHEHNFNHLSTGGGSAIAYISGETLPGMEPFAT